MSNENPLIQSLLHLADQCRALDSRITRTPAQLRDRPSWQRETIWGLEALAQALLEVCVLRTQVSDAAATGPEDQGTAYYGLADQEQLHATSLEEAVIEQLESLQPEDFPSTLVITRFRRAELNLNHQGPLESFLEHLDHQYGNPNSDSTAETQAMRTAEKAFVATVLQDFHIWRCDPVDSETVNVRRWLDQNAQRTGLTPWPRLHPSQTQLCGHCYQPRPTHELRTCRTCRRRGCPTCRTGRAHSELMLTEGITAADWQRARNAWLSLCRFTPVQ